MRGVRYFRTFIDVEDEEPAIPGPPRAQSCPPFGTIAEKLDEDVAASSSLPAVAILVVPADTATWPTLSVAIPRNSGSCRNSIKKWHQPN
ncbi:hypothetical protein AK812_SmicGene33026 [Symbiodinium microadriaticum]|uniref:Uncharacterized protein n=1 Tax=Symbiodinium microadriaticum TaxID=2951 RepID=A0A1Q9CSM8_SYMMI|nr:hypothetical protein AK812_SmicGene33026 [Symbiodinium microadriaticum]